jgi:hypothetical protein
MLAKFNGFTVLIIGTIGRVAFCKFLDLPHGYPYAELFLDTLQ